VASETAVEMSLLAVLRRRNGQIGGDEGAGLSAVSRSCRCWRLAGGEKAGSVGWRRRLGRSAVGFVSSVLAGFVGTAVCRLLLEAGSVELLLRCCW